MVFLAHDRNNARQFEIAGDANRLIAASLEQLHPAIVARHRRTTYANARRRS
jgi:hypothetical protein